jgi:hypothetical protein
VSEARTAPPRATSAEPLAHSNWKSRRAYAFAVTLALLFMLGWAIHHDKAGALDVLTWLLSTMFILWMVAPSAEQAVKMLATAAALRSGVAFTSHAEVDPRRGRAWAGVSAVPAETDAPERPGHDEAPGAPATPGGLEP